jgi:hypothetical protein
MSKTMLTSRDCINALADSASLRATAQTNNVQSNNGVTLQCGRGSQIGNDLISGKSNHSGELFL